nr:DUF2971 domain-containing protein [uncultured Draconibacterium sp.]
MIKKIGNRIFIQMNGDYIVGDLLPPWRIYSPKEYNTKSLCKFYSISENHNIDAIRDNYWYSTSPKSFNDFTDCNADLLSYQNIFQKYYNWTFENNIEKEEENELNTYAVKIQDEIYDKNLGVTCFSHSKNIYNHLMWSNYANDHKGICLQFDSIKPLKQGLFNIDNHLLLPVTYLRKNPVLKENAVLHIFPFIKFRCWRQEKEHRLVKFKQTSLTEEDRFIKYENSLVKAIYLGSRFLGHENHQKVLQVIFERYPNIDIYRMKLERKSFNLKAVNVIIEKENNKFIIKNSP